MGTLHEDLHAYLPSIHKGQRLGNSLVGNPSWGILGHSQRSKVGKFPRGETQLGNSRTFTKVKGWEIPSCGIPAGEFPSIHKGKRLENSLVGNPQLGN
jgi:hypothetical protein